MPAEGHSKHVAVHSWAWNKGRPHGSTEIGYGIQGGHVASYKTGTARLLRQTQTSEAFAIQQEKDRMKEKEEAPAIVM
jgi:hypothetical protein